MLGLLCPRAVARGDDHRNIGCRSQFLRQLQAVPSDKQTIDNDEIRSDTVEETFRAGLRANHEAAMVFSPQRFTSTLATSLLSSTRTM